MARVNSSMNLTSSVGLYDLYSDDIPVWARSVYTAYLILIIVIGFPGNVIITIVYGRTVPKSACDWLILTMGITDIVVCVFSPLLHLRTEYRVEISWMGGTACQLEQWIQGTAVIASCQILVVIALDRYVKICRPGMRSLNAKVAPYVCLLCVIVSGLITTYPIVAGYDFNMCMLQKTTDLSLVLKVYFTMTFGGFFISFVVVSFAYAKVCLVIEDKIKLKQRLLDNKGLTSLNKNGDQEQNADDDLVDPNRETSQSCRSLRRLCRLCTGWHRERKKKFDLRCKTLSSNEYETFFGQNTGTNETKYHNDKLQNTRADNSIVHQELSMPVNENCHLSDTQTGRCKKMLEKYCCLNCCSNRYFDKKTSSIEVNNSEKLQYLLNREEKGEGRQSCKENLLENGSDSQNPRREPQQTQNVKGRYDGFIKSDSHEHTNRQEIVPSDSMVQNAELHICNSSPLIEAETETNLQTQKVSKKTESIENVGDHIKYPETGHNPNQLHTLIANNFISEKTITDSGVAKVSSLHSEVPNRKLRFKIRKCFSLDIDRISSFSSLKQCKKDNGSCCAEKSDHFINLNSDSFPQSNSAPSFLPKTNVFSGPCTEKSERDKDHQIWSTPIESRVDYRDSDEITHCHQRTVSVIGEGERIRKMKMEYFKNNKNQNVRQLCLFTNKHIPGPNCVLKTPNMKCQVTPNNVENNVNLNLVYHTLFPCPLRRAKSETNIQVNATGKSNCPYLVWLDLSRSKTGGLTTERIRLTGSSFRFNTSDQCHDTSRTIAVNQNVLSDEIQINNEGSEKVIEQHTGELDIGNQEKEKRPVFALSVTQQNQSIKSFPENNESNSGFSHATSLQPPEVRRLKGSLKSPSSGASKSDQGIKKTPSFAYQLSTDMSFDNESLLGDDEAFRNKPSFPFLSRWKRSSSNSKKSKGSTKSAGSRKRFSREREMTLMLVSVTAAFILSWIPSWAITLTITFAPHLVITTLWRGNLLLYLAKLHLVNFVCNAIIYYRFNPTFRSKVKALLSNKDGACCFCFKNINLARSNSHSETTEHV